MRGLTPTFNWIVPGWPIAGAYPGSKDPDLLSQLKLKLMSIEVVLLCTCTYLLGYSIIGASLSEPHTDHQRIVT